MPGNTVRIAAVSDVHCTKNAQGNLQPLFSHIAREADVMVLAGDLTDYGLPDEAHVLTRELAGVRIPVVAVLGNHDFESDQQEEVANILREAGVQLLDGEAVEVHGVGFAGIKGYAGGFGRYTFGAWGESANKAFVQAALDEALKLESALARLRTPQRLAVLHYAPVEGTVRGEPLEIYPFLGTSRLEEPLSRYPVTAVVHGHAHNGTPEGQLANGTPVYNVSLALMRKVNADAPFRLIEVDPEQTAEPALTAEEA